VIVISVGTPVLIDGYMEARIEAFGHDWVIYRKENGEPDWEYFTTGAAERDNWAKQCHEERIKHDNDQE
jgi:hypothetical protein